jgi:hypothetical protein
MRFFVTLSKVGKMATIISKADEICCSPFKSREHGNKKFKSR